MILRNKSRYQGPVKISRDLTLIQRKHFKNLRQQLGILKEAGETDKTIRYFNGVPKIVSVNKKQEAKN